MRITKTDLIRHWTLSSDDRAAIGRRRRDRNRLGFALQLCARRYPGRLLRPGEAIPEAALRFVADQLGADPEALTDYAARFQTGYEQLDALWEAFGFSDLAPVRRCEMLAWLLQVALATTNAFAIAQTLIDELRRRRIITPRPFVVEQLVAGATVLAERHIAGQLTRTLTEDQAVALETLLGLKEGTAMSILIWARQPAGVPGHKAPRPMVNQLACLHAVGLDPACAEGVHPERLRKLVREGADGSLGPDGFRPLRTSLRSVVRADEP